MEGTIISQPIEIIMKIFYGGGYLLLFFLKKGKKDSKLEWISVGEKVILRKAFI